MERGEAQAQTRRGRASYPIIPERSTTRHVQRQVCGLPNGALGTEGGRVTSLLQLYRAGLGLGGGVLFLSDRDDDIRMAGELDAEGTLNTTFSTYDR